MTIGSKGVEKDRVYKLFPNRLVKMDPHSKKETSMLGNN